MLDTHLKLRSVVQSPYLHTGDLVTVKILKKSPYVSDEELAKRKAETTLPPLYDGVLIKPISRFFRITWC